MCEFCILGLLREGEKMRGLACNACNEEFPNEEAQKQHYKTEWHRYNLRRKVAGVPGVTEALFNLRIEALEAERKKKEGERLLYKCHLCNKEYTTVKAHANHLQSKLHVTRAAAADAPADAGTHAPFECHRRLNPIDWTDCFCQSV